MSMLDAARSVVRIARTSVLIGIDGAAARLTGLPTRVGRVDARWLEAALSERHPGARLRGFEVLDAHSGTTSRARIALEYATRGDGDPPETIFLKLTPPGFVGRLFLGATGIGQNEVRFYRDLRPELPVRAPRVHGIRSLGDGRQFVLLLEDLGAQEVQLAAVGDQVSREEAARVMEALAVLHTRYREGAGASTLPGWLPSFESRVARGDMAWERCITSMMVERACARFASELPPELAEVAALCSEKRDHLESLWSRGPRTLCHGDCHVGNLFFEPERVGFFDWQVCARAPGLRDVSYFLTTSLPTKLRSEHERGLIAHYLEALTAAGAPAPSLEEAFESHRLFVLYAWIAAAFTAAAGDALQDEAIALAGLRRSTAAALELDSVATALGWP
jgi:aminoglycoside phosphotransferase (APT) family kinase protein